MKVANNYKNWQTILVGLVQVLLQFDCVVNPIIDKTLQPKGDDPSQLNLTEY